MKLFMLSFVLCLLGIDGICQSEGYDPQGMKAWSEEMKRNPPSPSTPPEKYKDLPVTYPIDLSKKQFRMQGFHDSVRVFLRANYLQEATRGKYDRIEVTFHLSDKKVERTIYYFVERLSKMR